MSALEEDKAETFAAMMATGEVPVLLRLARSDGVLDRKVNDLRTFLYGLDNTFTDQYWQQLLRSGGQAKRA